MSARPSKTSSFASMRSLLSLDFARARGDKVDARDRERRKLEELRPPVLERRLPQTSPEEPATRNLARTPHSRRGRLRRVRRRAGRPRHEEDRDRRGPESSVADPSMPHASAPLRAEPEWLRPPLALATSGASCRFRRPAAVLRSRLRWSRPLQRLLLLLQVLLQQVDRLRATERLRLADRPV